MTSPTSAADLECDDVIYHHHYFAFDPESVERNNGFFRMLLPHFTSQLVLPNADGDQVEVVTTNVAALLDPIFWCGITIIAALILLTITCCCQCCLACQCAVQRNEKKPIGLKICCGTLTWILTALILACAVVILWSEFTMDQGVQMHWSNMLIFVNGTVPIDSFANAMQEVMGIWGTYQLYRHWVSIALSIITILFMLIVMLAVCFCTPYMNKMNPMVTMLIINAVWVCVIILITAATFFSLFYMSFLCYDLYRIGGTTRCSDANLLQYSLSLQSFCSTDVYIPHLIAVAVYFVGLVIFMIVWQIFGACYASTFSGREPVQKPAVPHTQPDPDHIVQTGQEAHEMVTTTTTTYEEYVQRQPPVNPYAPPAFFVPSPNNFQPGYQPAYAVKNTSTNASEMVPHSPPQYDDCWNTT